MAGHPLWPDDVERKVNGVLDDVQKKLTALDPLVKDAPTILAELRGLITDARAELAEIKAARERLMGRSS